MEDKDRRALDLAVGAGRLLLESGAEISRVEDTMHRITSYYGIPDSEQYVCSNTIIQTAINGRKQMYAKVNHVPLSGVQLDKVDAVNQLSREIVQGKWPLEGAEQELERIKKLPGKSLFSQLAGGAIGSAGFCYLFDGTLIDCVAAFWAGLVLCIFLALIERRQKKTAKLLVNIAGAFIGTSVGIGFWMMGVGVRYSSIVAGTVMPLLPGVPFVNAIRDFANGDYLSGTVRFIDAALVTFGIAMGVGAFFILYSQVGGTIQL